jgi:hypothetical protein
MILALQIWTDISTNQKPGATLSRPISIYECHQKPNPARESVTVPLKNDFFDAVP